MARGIIVPSLQPRAGVADVTLADVSGRRMATLASGHRGAGHHDIAWPAAPSEVSQLPAGVYWIRVRTPGHQTARRVVHVW